MLGKSLDYDEDKVKLNKLLEDSEADKEQVLGVLSEILDVCKNYSDYEANHSDLEQFERSHTTESGDKNCGVWLLWV